MPLKAWISQKFRFITPRPPVAGNPKSRAQAYMRLGGRTARLSPQRNGEIAGELLGKRSSEKNARALPRLAALDLGPGLQHGADRGGVVLAVAAFERCGIARQRRREQRRRHPHSLGEG